jgi:FkbM family methyltransferase
MTSRADLRPISSATATLPQTAGPSVRLAEAFRNSPYFRGKARLQRWLLHRSGVERVNVFGYAMSLDLSDVIQRDMYAGVYEPFEGQCLKRLLRPGMTVVDVGANVGYYTWLASRLVGPAGRVLSFEPGPYAFERLQRVIAENSIRNVEACQIALSDHGGRATLYVPQKEEGNYNPSLTPYLPDMTAVDVAVDRLDTLLDRFNVGTVDLMKVDVEGHELNVFRGASLAVGEGRIANVLCEFNEGYQAGAGHSCNELERWLSNAGFHLAKSFPSKWGSRVHNRLYTARSARNAAVV